MTNPEQLDKQSSAARLDRFGLGIVNAMHDLNTFEGQIDRGVAVLSDLREPVKTRYGTATQVYDYQEGCRPVTELAQGIQAIFFRAKDAKGDAITFSVGKMPEDKGKDMYRFFGYRGKQGDTETVIEGLVPEPEITAPVVLHGACRLSDVLPNSVQDGSPIDLEAYKIDLIHGLAGPDGRG